MQEKYEPRSVRELLTEMKNVSDIMIDLSYAAVLFNSREIAEQVHGLEERMDDLMYEIRAIAAIAVRNIEEAKQITGVLQIASMAEAISNATGDIADLILHRRKIHPLAREALASADEKLAKIEVGDKAQILNKRLWDLRLPSTIGVWIPALKSEKHWLVPPTKNTEIKVGDLLIIKGPQDGIRALRKLADVKEEKLKFHVKFPRICRTLAEMRDMSGMIVDLAYFSLLLNSKEIAQEAKELQEKFNHMSRALWLNILQAAKVERDLEGLRGVLQLARSMERISGATEGILGIVLEEVELHPIFAQALSESDEQVSRIDIGENSSFVGRSLKELNLWATTGAYVLMIKRGKRNMVDPSRRIKIKAGDSLIIRGSLLGVKKVKKASLRTASSPTTA